jgi:hypothetical protein
MLVIIESNNIDRLLDAIACPLDRSTGTQPDLGRHLIQELPHPQRLDASGQNSLLDFFLFKMVRAHCKRL